MRWRRVCSVLIAVLALGGLGATSHAAAPGEIVFASDRGKDDPGEIYELTPGSKLHDVSRSLAADSGVAVSPVGDRIAFWSDRSGRARIYLARSNGSGLRVVGGIALPLADLSDEGPIVFSANGRRIVGSFSPDTVNAAPHVFAIDPTRASARRLAWCQGTPELAPDGLLVACVRSVDRPDTVDVYTLGGARAFSVPGVAAIWSAAGLLAVASRGSGPEPGRTGHTTFVDGTGRVFARLAGYPLEWAPDGSALVLARGGSLVAGRPTRGTGERALVEDWPGGPVTITPDSRDLVSQTATSAVEVPLAGGAPRTALGSGLGVWSRTGRIAYLDYAAQQASATHTTIALMITDAHGLHPRLQARFPYDEKGDQQTLDWAADGRHLLVTTTVECGGSDLYEVSPGGGPTRRLTDDARDLEQPAWSPDGTRIAYGVESSTCGEGDPHHIETIAANGTDPVRVTDDGGGEGSFDAFPAYTPDGTRIIFQSGTFDSTRMQSAPAGGGDRTTLATFEPAGETPAVSPDGSRIAFLEGASIMALPVNGGAAVRLAPNPGHGRGCGGGLAWSPDGTAIAVGGQAGIYLVRLAASPSARLAIAARCAGDPSFSPDGTQIAFDTRTTDGTGDSAIMAARVDGSDLRRLSATPFRQSVHPSWQP